MKLPARLGGDLGALGTWFKEALKPDPILTVSEWADEHRMLSRKASSEPGKWSTSRTPYLREIMDTLSVFHPARKIVFKKSSQIGGALALDTPVPTIDGWATMASLRVGDMVFDEKGRPCRVTYKSPVFTENNCYRITFSDGAQIVCDHVHKWTVYDETDYRRIKRRTLFTPGLEENFLKHIRGKKKFTYQIPVQEPLRCEERGLPLDPYLFGVYLANGSRSSGQLSFHVKDADEILGRIGRERLVRADSLNCVNVLIRGLCAELNKNEMLHKKEIPQIYLRASFDQRLKLLQGLMDCDGSISGNRCEYSSVDESLARGVKELLASLGIKYSDYSKISTRGFSGLKTLSPRMMYRISFTTFRVPVFALKRKLSKMRTEGRVSETLKRRIVGVERIATVPTACISVDSPSHLYLCGREMVPTHNTECGNNWLGYIIDHVPGPVMLIQPTVDTARRNSKLRIEPMIDESPRLKAKMVAPRSKKASNTVQQKDFNGGTLVMAGANSAAGLRSMPAKYLMLDEVDAYPRDVDGEGDPIALVMARSRTFSRRKAFLISTPTIDGLSKIDDEYRDSDRREYFVPCPHCEKKQTLKFEGLKWTEGKPAGTSYFCEHCGEEIPERFKTDMLAKGEWVPGNPDHETVGFFINSLYSPLGWYSWGDIARDYEEAKREHEQEKKTEKLRTFTNTVLGKTYEEPGEAPEWKRLYLRREPYKIGACPKGTLFITCGVDVQKDRVELEVVAWGRRKESWSVDYQVLSGDTAGDEVWDTLEEYLGKTFPGEDGAAFPIKMTAIDSGFRTQEVYNFCRKFAPNRVTAVKGNDNLSVVVGLPRIVDAKLKGRVYRRAAKVWNIGVSILKAELYGWLNMDPPIGEEKTPTGFCHFPEYDEEYFKQLTAEKVVTKRNRKGYTAQEWVKERERNEALDCRIYNRAAASLAGLDRMKDKDAERLEKKNIAKAIDPPNTEKGTGSKSKRQRKPRARSEFWG